MIREATKNDAKACAEIYNHYILNSTATFDLEPISEKEMIDKLFGCNSILSSFVAEKNGIIAGYCYVHPWKTKPAYGRTVETTIYLRPGFESKGLGRKLMTTLIDACREAQVIKVLIACITAENQSSISFHEKLGFKQVSHFHNVGEKFGRNLDVIDLQLELL